MHLDNKTPLWATLAVSAVLLTACGGKSESAKSNNNNPVSKEAACIEDDANAREKVLTQLSQAVPGTTVSFCEGHFDMPTGLLVNSKRGITLKGAGKDKTILNFANSDSGEGINATNSDGLVLEGFTVEDTPGNGVRVHRSEHITIRDVRVRWHDAEGRNENDPGYTPRSDVGAYGLYPVETRQVLMENCESHGASDAGIYVGQSSDIIVRNCLATYNVAGYEFENTYRALFEDNVATKNTGGFLVFDLPDLRQYGEKNVIRRNKSYNNNTDNFAPVGNIVGVVPRGTGMLVVASDQLEIYDNEIYDNDSFGIAMVNYGLIDHTYPDQRYDFFPEGIEIHNNTFSGNGTNPQLPIADRGVASALPLLLRVKSLGGLASGDLALGADIVWDGGEDVPNDCTEYPRDQYGVPLNQDSPQEKAGDRYEARVDERGRPNFDAPDQEPTCKYNAWKFDSEGKLKKPENGICMRNNTHLSTMGVTPFLNAGLSRSDLGPETVQQLITPGSTDMSPHDCDLPDRPIPELKLPYEIVAEDAAPTEAEVLAACNAVQPGKVNWNALAKYDCPEISQYGLFKEPNNPLSGGLGEAAFPYELNSTLFSDYASKYRVIFLPPKDGGGVQPAVYQDKKSTGSINASLKFPVGTVIAKTFTFRTEDAEGNLEKEHIVETRLLINRKTAVGETWVGLPYVWEQGTDGMPTKAVLKLAGETVSATWDYVDPNPDVKNADGTRKRYTGAAPNYAVPAALNCIGCHGGDDRLGAAPIGPKARNMDRGMDKDHGGENQLAYMFRQGWLDRYPDASERDAPLATADVPLSGAEASEQYDQIHKRVRAYLEVNCSYCHNGSGGASNSGLFLDSFRPVNVRYGICKKPVAAGRGSGGRKHDIVLEKPESSILYYRVSSDEAGVRMPPIARSVVHGEGSALINRWIATALPDLDNADDTQVANENNCTDSDLPLLLSEVLPTELSDAISELQEASGGTVSISDATDFLEMLTKGINNGVTELSSATQRSERSIKGMPAN